MSKSWFNFISVVLLFAFLQIVYAAPIDDFVIKVKTDNPGFTIAEMFRIPTKSALTYDYNVDCNNDGTDEATGQTGDYYCDYSASGLNLGAGTYTIRIKDNTGTGDGFPSINFNNTFDRLKIIELVQWGTGKWTNMQRSFYGTENMVVTATDNPDFSQVTTMESMFRRALLASPDTSNWNTAMVTTMKSLFNEAEVATPDTTNWDTHLVDDMSFMFRHAYLARPDVINWDFSQVNDMTGMFSLVDLPVAYYDNFLAELSHKNIQPNVVFNGGIGHYCSKVAQDAHFYLENTANWTITDGLLCDDSAPEHDFVFTVDTTITGFSPNTEYLIKTDATYNYSYLVDCNNDGVVEGTAIGSGANYLCDYSTLGGPGIYTIRIKNFPGFHTGFAAFPFVGSTTNHDQAKIISLDQWGTGEWLLTSHAFNKATNMIYNAKDIPDFSSVSSMGFMFEQASLASPETKFWDTLNVTDMSNMFYLAVIANPNTSLWNTSKVENMLWMFRDTELASPDTSFWDTSKVVRMDAMFLNADIANPDTSNWDTSMVTKMNAMFNNAVMATPDTSNWDITQVDAMVNMFSGVTLATINYQDILLNFAGQSVMDNVSFHGGNSQYCSQAAQNARAKLINTYGWTITDGGLCNASDAANDFVFKVDTTIPVIAGGTSNTEYKIRINSTYSYDYNVDCNDDGVFEITGATADYTCDYSSLGGAGVYTIRIKDNIGNRRGFSGFGLVGASTDYDQKKIIELIQWGTFKWQSMEQAFLRASNMLVTATDVPDFSEVNNMNSMFSSAILANPQTKYWDTSNVENMGSMFRSAWSANPDTSLWDTATVDHMHSMFRGALNANPNTSNWNTSNVQSMESMFRGATSANPDTSNWDISNVSTMLFMFDGVTLPTVNYDAMLIGFESQIVQNGVDFDGGNSIYCSAAAQLSHDKLQSNFSWTITDAGLCNASDPANDFVITVKTDNAGFSDADKFMIFVNSDVSNHYNVDCNNDGINEILGATTTMLCDYSAVGLNTGAGTYTIRIKDAIGDRTGLAGFIFQSDGQKILSLDQWGTSKWQKTVGMFKDTTNLVINAIDIPDFSQTTSMSSMFFNSPLVNPDTRLWDVSQVTNMAGMFALATNARPDISLWSLSQVTSMEEIFGMVALPINYYDNMLITLAGKSLQNNVLFGGPNSTYTYCSQAAQLARLSLINSHSWTVNDGGLDASCTIISDVIFENSFEAVVVFKAAQQQFNYDFSEASIDEISHEPLLIAKGLDQMQQPVIKIYLRNDLGQLQIRKDQLDLKSMTNQQWIMGQWQSIDNTQLTTISWE